MTDQIPPVAVRIAQQVRLARTGAVLDQSDIAAALGGLGTPTKVATLTRIESSRQPITVEQLLLLALFAGPAGLRSFLVPPFTIGELTIADEDDLNALLDGREVPYAPVCLDVDRRLDGIWDERHNQRIADEIMSTPERVAEVSPAIFFGRSAYEEIRVRLMGRFDDLALNLDDPMEISRWRAYLNNTRQRVQKEIQEAIASRDGASGVPF